MQHEASTFTFPLLQTLQHALDRKSLTPRLKTVTSSQRPSPTYRIPLPHTPTTRLAPAEEAPDFLSSVCHRVMQELLAGSGVVVLTQKTLDLKTRMLYLPGSLTRKLMRGGRPGSPTATPHSSSFFMQQTLTLKPLSPQTLNPKPSKPQTLNPQAPKPPNPKP